DKFIIYGYQEPLSLYFRSISDVKKLYNKTVNIWSYLLAAILFSIILIYNPSIDTIIVLNFTLGVIIYFTYLLAYYLFSNHSKRVANWWQRINYLGVVIVI
ncbi:hypothetical protein V2W45_1227812, partial [Cenococcum geophilum]